MTEIYCVICGNFVKGKDLVDGEGICEKCSELVEEVAEIQSSDVM